MAFFFSPRRGAGQPGAGGGLVGKAGRGLLVVWLLLAPWWVWAQAPAPAAGAAPSVSTILNPDGTLKAGAQGSFDATGYQISAGRGGQPVLQTTADGWNALPGNEPGLLHGVNGIVITVAVSGSNVYVGGLFTAADNAPANNVARWDGTAWSGLGTGADNGVNGVVSALAISGSDVYVGGNFTAAGGKSTNNVAKWNGTAWSSLGTGITRPDPQVGVYALAVSGTEVYAGGIFDTAGGVPANNVAKWNGTAWSSLGTGTANGVSSIVRALAAIGSTVYVGGDFTKAGGTTANFIAQWNGTSWSTLNNGVNNAVSTLAVSGTELYVGGRFTTAGGAPARYVARWNGTAWNPVSNGSIDGLNGEVKALAVSGSEAYVATYLSNAGVSKWDGKGWSLLPLPNGAGAVIYTLAVSGTGPYVGGELVKARRPAARR